MSGQLSIKADTSDVERMLKNLVEVTSPIGMTVWMETVMEPWLQARVRSRFGTEGDDVSGQWLPLRPYTQMVRSQSGYGAEHPINIRTGELLRYLDSSDAGIVAIPSGTQMTYPGVSAGGSLAEKLSTAQVGSPDGRTPARPVLGLSLYDLQQALITLSAFVQAGANKP